MKSDMDSSRTCRSQKCRYKCGFCVTYWKHWDLVIDAYQMAVLDPPQSDHLFSWMQSSSASHCEELLEPMDWSAACALHTACRRRQDRQVDHGLASLLIRFRTFLCSDPRDKIYAIFRLSQESSHIKPDYSRPVAALYKEAVRESFANSFQRLAFLSMLDYEHRDPTLPSWCPSFHKPTPKGRPFYRSEYRSTQRYYAIPTFHGSIMTILGAGISKIASIITCVPDSVIVESDDLLGPLMSTVKSLCISRGDIAWIRDQQYALASPSSELSSPLSAQADYFSAGSEPDDIRCVAKATNNIAPREYSAREDRICAENWLEIILKDGKTAVDYDNIVTLSDLKDICQTTSRQIIQCEDGSYGHVPLSARAGDRLAVFLGGKVPFCIREDPDRTGCYHIIGDS